MLTLLFCVLPNAFGAMHSDRLIALMQSFKYTVGYIGIVCYKLYLDFLFFSSKYRNIDMLQNLISTCCTNCWHHVLRHCLIRNGILCLPLDIFVESTCQQQSLLSLFYCLIFPISLPMRGKEKCWYCCAI